MLSAEAKLEVDNTNQGLDNSSYYAKIEFNNCFIIHVKKPLFVFSNLSVVSFSPPFACVSREKRAWMMTCFMT